jgi:alpha-D-ribose 1-methylphosphonate 5-triphosphate synthase subunit PhnG
MSTSTTSDDRAGWLRVLALAERRELEEAWSTVREAPPVTVMRRPETGLVMVRGRMGAVGRRFNLGEMTVTRCAVSAGDLVGHGYVQGRDKRKAELVARFDLLLQMPERRQTLLRDVVRPLAEARNQRRAAEARKAAATRVDFFALVRGEG